MFVRPIEPWFGRELRLLASVACTPEFSRPWIDAAREDFLELRKYLELFSRR